MQIGTPESGNFRGYEVDLLQEVARRLDVTIQYRRALWSVIVAELSSSSLDLVCSAATARDQAVSGYKSVCKLLVLKEVVGAKGFEPSTSWSRTGSFENPKSCRWCRIGTKTTFLQTPQLNLN
jgi:ABC-type amino acid transport substrate-binding protein